jgi:hypothetical protein
MPHVGLWARISAERFALRVGGDQQSQEFVRVGESIAGSRCQTGSLDSATFVSVGSRLAVQPAKPEELFPFVLSRGSQEIDEGDASSKTVRRWSDSAADTKKARVCCSDSTGDSRR